jgi:hypothetical protein
MASIRHTYLFDEARWSARGTFFGTSGEATPLDGITQITHGEDTWLNRSLMRLRAAPPIELTSDYRVKPFAPDAMATQWESHSPALGRLLGNFALVGDSVLSTFASEDGVHSGSECLQMMESDRYLGRGVLYRDRSFFYAWIVELRRE